MYEFGPFRLDAGEYVLLRDGQVIPLSPKVFETLLVLVENSGHVVDKHELYKQVWQDAFVEESNLTKNISILRKILSEGDGERTFIETIPKRGYRFVIPVRTFGSEPGVDEVRSLSPVNAKQSVGTSTSEQIDNSNSAVFIPNAHSRIGKRKFILIAVVLVVCLIATASLKFFGSESIVTFDSAKITRLTTSGMVTVAAVSPDGKLLAYATTDGAERTLWLQQAAPGSSATPIVPPGPSPFNGLTFDRDGSSVYFTQPAVEAGLTDVLYQVPILGGTPRKVVSGIWGKPGFSPDGKQITYYSNREGEELLMVANADGSNERKLVSAGENEFFLWSPHGPSWSPGGETIAAIRGNYAPRRVAVITIKVNTGEVVQVGTNTWEDVADVAWLSDGSGILVVAGKSPGRRKIWYLSYPVGEAKLLSTDVDNYDWVSLTADSKAIVTVQQNQYSNISTGGIADPVLSTEVTTGSAMNTGPAWTPDGKLVFSRYTGGDDTDLFLADIALGTSRQLTHRSEWNAAPTVTADGRYIFFFTNRDGTDNIWRMDVDGGNQVRVTSGFDAFPSLSDDGTTLVFLDNGKLEAASRMDTRSGERTLINERPCVLPRISPDGKYIVCMFKEDAKRPMTLSVIPVAGGPPFKSFPIPAGYSGTGFRWQSDSRAFVYPVTSRGVTNLWRQATDGSPARQITNFTAGRISNYDISRDGKQIAVSRSVATRDVVLISDFRK